jgi:hypothetical protein
MALASWLPVRAGPAPRGLRHGHQTWLDDLKIRYILQSERMGHEVEGMRGMYRQITPRMRAELTVGLQELRGCSSRTANAVPRFALSESASPIPESDIRGWSRGAGTAKQAADMVDRNGGLQSRRMKWTITVAARAMADATTVARAARKASHSAPLKPLPPVRSA